MIFYVLFAFIFCEFPFFLAFFFFLSRFPTLRVLLVEDNLTNIKVFTKIAASCGIIISESNVAQDGVIALQLLRQQKFDIVFMDLHMPNMDGLQVSFCDFRVSGLFI